MGKTRKDRRDVDSSTKGQNSKTKPVAPSVPTKAQKEKGPPADYTPKVRPGHADLSTKKEAASSSFVSASAATDQYVERDPVKALAKLWDANFFGLLELGGARFEVMEKRFRNEYVARIIFLRSAVYESALFDISMDESCKRTYIATNHLLNPKFKSVLAIESSRAVQHAIWSFISKITCKEKKAADSRRVAREPNKHSRSSQFSNGVRLATSNGKIVSPKSPPKKLETGFLENPIGLWETSDHVVFWCEVTTDKAKTRLISFISASKGHPLFGISKYRIKVAELRETETGLSGCILREYLRGVLRQIGELPPLEQQAVST